MDFFGYVCSRTQKSGEFNYKGLMDKPSHTSPLIIRSHSDLLHINEFIYFAGWLFRVHCKIMELMEREHLVVSYLSIIMELVIGTYCVYLSCSDKSKLFSPLFLHKRHICCLAPVFFLSSDGCGTTCIRGVREVGCDQVSSSNSRFTEV